MLDDRHRRRCFCDGHSVLLYLEWHPLMEQQEAPAETLHFQKYQSWLMYGCDAVVSQLYDSSFQGDITGPGFSSGEPLLVRYNEFCSLHSVGKSLGQICICIDSCSLDRLHKHVRFSIWAEVQRCQPYFLCSSEIINQQMECLVCFGTGCPM